ncbi:dual specificity protein phosphatase 12 [Erpetoichthys calabaricus]|uniref:Dual specificity protein phosphatase 12 n=1 Tax=Erpetoichthys calabaricus TaxID=27687 RepID=A0A8C4S083_ERPCA|nr:dual specificity protein phosphatase 12 [Erpetoichthys calabaricus]XP_028666984.1 dual specificity protein phosphatase 12 [Erpetoichthys calabaricus]
MITVLPRLFLGGAADVSEPRTLSESGITHVLTVDAEEPRLADSFKTKFVFALDESCTDLLSFLDECIQFISDALSLETNNVLVHCHAGVSRSAAVIIAFMMKTCKLTLKDAHVRLENIKTDIRVNDEFLHQLELFESMDCNIDISNPIYKQYRLQKVTQKYPELQNLPREYFAVDPTATTETQFNEVIYKCRKCRRSLFRNSSILNHISGSEPAAFVHKRMNPINIQTVGKEQNRCTSYFIEPVQWMEPALLGVMDGQLLCPKCSSKLGSFNWYGEQCSCGRWITPAFQIHKTRVDELKKIALPSMKLGNS